MKKILIVADLKVIKSEVYCWYLIFLFKTIIENLEHINEAVETIDMLIVSAIEQLKKSKKRSDEHAILEYLQKKGNRINQQTLSLSLTSLSKIEIILSKASSGKNSCSIKASIAPKQIAVTPTPLENPSTLSSSEFRVFSKCHDYFRIKQIENLKVQSCKLYNNKCMVALTQIRNT